MTKAEIEQKVADIMWGSPPNQATENRRAHIAALVERATAEAAREATERAAKICESGIGDVLGNDECCRANAAAIRAEPQT